MRVDAHQHYWRYSPEEYGWIDDSISILNRDHLPEHLAPLLQENHVNGTVAVQARQTHEETRGLLDLANQFPFILGVVGWVDLHAENVMDVLEDFSPQPGFCGVRHVLQDEPDDRFMLRDDFLRGLSCLQRFDLSYDLLLYPRHLPMARELVERFPKQRFIVDHLAKPPIQEGRLSPWDEDLRRLAAHENVYCKISGMVTEADWFRWKPSDFTAYVDVALEAFGTKRLVFGSDWPVCTVAASYTEVLELARETLKNLSESEQEDIFGGNARRFYKLAGG